MITSCFKLTFSSNDKSFLLDYSLAFCKKIITDDYDKNICKMIDQNTYPELKIINPTNNIIKKEQLIELQQLFLVKPTLGNKMVYIINGADKLHASSANTILKFLEEPNEDIVAILLTDNLAKVLPTIKSRCQNLIFMNKKEEFVGLNMLYNYYYENIEEKEEADTLFKELIDNSIKFINYIENKGLKTINHYKEFVFESFKSKVEMTILFDFILYFYYDILNLKVGRNIVYMKDYEEELNKISELNSVEKVQEKLQIIENSKLKLDTNMNLKLFMDQFLIKFCEV